MIDWRAHSTLIQVAGIVMLAGIAVTGCVYGHTGASLTVFIFGSCVVAVWVQPT